MGQATVMGLFQRSSHGFEKQISIHRPQQNGVAVYVYCIIVEMERSVLRGQKLNKLFWAKVEGNAIDICNDAQQELCPQLHPKNVD